MGEAGDRVDLGGRRLEALSLGGADVRNADFAGTRVRDGMFANARLNGMIDGLEVNGIEVAPLIWAEMLRLDPDLVLTVSDEVEDLRAAWDIVGGRWDRAVARARTLGAGAEHERVDDEWSLVETLRHLIFVTDGWISRTVRGAESPYHGLGLPPSFLPDLSALGIEAFATPGLDEVLAVRAERQSVVSDLLSELDQDGLARRCAANPARGYPPDTTVPVLRCLQTVLSEEFAHHRYAVRDLDAIEASRV